jgi:hypothetical protein
MELTTDKGLVLVVVVLKMAAFGSEPTMKKAKMQWARENERLLQYRDAKIFFKFIPLNQKAEWLSQTLFIGNDCGVKIGIFLIRVVEELVQEHVGKVDKAEAKLR